MEQPYYSPPNRSIWKGRSTDIPKEYWYQSVIFSDLNAEIQPNTVALLGYACDEGVRRNQGRVGAKEGPSAIRQQLARQSYHHKTINVVDYGDINCVEQDLERCQSDLAEAVSRLLKSGLFPIVLGGGHDAAYGHYNGIRKVKKGKVGVLNLDAHFDLRPLRELPNSGTPFYQILHSDDERVSYFVLGIQRQSNTKELFGIAEQLNVAYIENRHCHLGNIDPIVEQVKAFIGSVDHLYLTIDLDGFSSAFAPGVSAPSPLGFEPMFVFQLLPEIFNSGKVVSCDIVELNPIYDRDHSSTKLAASLVDNVVGYVNP